MSDNNAGRVARRSIKCITHTYKWVCCSGMGGVCVKCFVISFSCPFQFGNQGLIPLSNTIHPVLSGHSKLNKLKVSKTNGSLMKVESIAECSIFLICIKR